MRLTVVFPTKLSSSALIAKKETLAVGQVRIEFDNFRTQKLREHNCVLGVFYARKKTAKLRMSI